MALRVTPLGAGREVGRSCILLEISGRRVLLDCGVNLGARDRLRYLPRFDLLEELLPPSCRGDLTKGIDAVFISHFHMDHVAALPYLTCTLGYRGPIFMTHPTRAIIPIMLDDSLKFRSKFGDQIFTAEHIDVCLGQVQGMQVHERVVIDDDLVLTPYHAGHVIGAAMVLVECRGRSALYTGDFTMVPDHHLSSAKLPMCLRPDVMITEATYSTTIRSSKRVKEQELCRKIEETLTKGGKVLVPIGAMGKAQEFCALCEKHWARVGLRFPIYIAKGMMEKALNIFSLFASWSSEAVRNSDDPFSFPHVQTYDNFTETDADKPMVLFAGPAMLHTGLSLRMFKEWAPDPKNLIVFPGFALPGTIGHEVLRGSKKVQVEEGEVVNVACRVEYMSHSDHTDARGILDLLQQSAPMSVVLVHGSEEHMATFKPIVEKRTKVICYDPAVGITVDLAPNGPEVLQEVLVTSAALAAAESIPPPPVLNDSVFEPLQRLTGILLRKRDHPWELHALSSELAQRALKRPRINFRHHEPKLPSEEFREARCRFEAGLRRRLESFTWDPRPPPDIDVASGAKFTLTAGALICEIGTLPENHLVVDVRWEHEEARHNPVKLVFLEALNAW